MKLTKKGEYALKAMIALARADGAPMTITQVAEAQNLPKKFLEQILLAMKTDGLLTSKAGPRGGYMLAGEYPSSAITVGRVLAAVEEPMSRAPRRPVSLAVSGGGTTPSGVATMLDDIRTYVREKLETVTIEELAAQDLPPDEVEALMWYI